MTSNIYDWESAAELLEKLVKPVFEKQENLLNQPIIKPIDDYKKEKLKAIVIPEEPISIDLLKKHLYQDVYPYRDKLNHPRYFSFIPNSVSPYSIIGDTINASHNPYGGGTVLSEGPTIIEKMFLNWLGEQIGYDPKKLGGSFVSGGSMANLTGIILARDEYLEPEEYLKGLVYVSDQTHSSVAKGVRIAGISPNNVRKVPTDDNFMMDTSKLEEMIEEDISQGFKPFLIVGTCGTTNTGAIDPLEELSEISKKYNMWYHVDGAYGASYIFSKDKDKLKGIELSDSLSWDAHKLLFQTYGCAMIIVKDLRKMVNSFSVGAEYLKDVETDINNVNFWDIGIEMTKPFRGMRLYTFLQLVGLNAVKEALNHTLDSPKYFYEEVSKYDFFEVVSKPQLATINFRYYNPKYTLNELNQINHKLSQMGLERGYAVYYTTMLRGKIVLRFCSTSTDLSRKEIKNIVDNIVEDIKSLGL